MPLQQQQFVLGKRQTFRLLYSVDCFFRPNIR
jgi:hypothetical protein